MYRYQRWYSTSTTVDSPPNAQLFEQRLGHDLDPENSEDDALSVEAILLDRDLDIDGECVVGKPNKDYLALRQDWQRRKTGNAVLDSR